MPRLSVALFAIAAMAAAILIIINVIALAVSGPEPRQPTPPGQVSPECTEEDLADGSCYTWQDFHDSEWRTD